jgi:hypothetical protein
MELDQWIKWALAADLPSNRSIGQHAVGRVLVALATYANRDGIAWPSTYTLADDVSGLSRRDIRNALEALDDAGVITKAGKAGRATRWRLNAPDEEAGDPAHRRAGEQAGQWAGEWAGKQAGYPAPNRTEGNPSPTAAAASSGWGAGGAPTTWNPAAATGTGGWGTGA